MKYKAPRGIVNHPGVLECDSGEGGGSDYKHDVILREGWEFKYGRMAGVRCGFFHTVADFKFAKPVRELRAMTDCECCKGSGELAYRTRDGSFKCAGPVPDDARGVFAGKCYDCNGTGQIGDDREECDE